jgi:hypothetical protein
MIEIGVSGCHSCRRKFMHGPESSGLFVPFCLRVFLLNGYQSGRWLVGAVGIELKAALKPFELLIRINAKNAKYTGIAQLRYTRGIRDRGE